MIKRKTINTPFEYPMILFSDGSHLVKVDFLYEEDSIKEYEETVEEDDQILLEAAKQLGEYFKRKRKNFDLPLLSVGTDFQQKVWQILSSIPYGEIVTYKEIAEKANSPKAFRAAGGACRANRFPVIIPCHRVLSTNGKYTGYAGDKVFMKEKLLNFEAKTK